MKQRVGAASFDRAARCAPGLGALRRQDRTLRATCQGTAPEPYALHVTLGAFGVAEAECSCPVGDGGRCKHVAALLLRWRREPQAFAETQPLEQALAELDRDALLALVGRMVHLHPDLEALVTASPAALPTPGAVRRQVRQLLDADPYEWGAAVQIGRALERLVLQADAAALRGDWPGATAVLDALLDSLATREEWLHDESGAVLGVVADAALILARGLDTLTDAALRAPIVDLLYDVVRTDHALGGLGVGDGAEAALVAHATHDERGALVGRITRDLESLSRPAGGLGEPDRWTDGWRRRELGRLALAFQPGELGDEMFLALCRASGRHADLVERLLALGRSADALAHARTVSDMDLVALAPHFQAHGHGAALDALAVDRLDDASTGRFVAWVKDRARDRGDAELAQTLAERLFWARPSFQQYVEVVALGDDLGRADAVRDALQTRLLAEKRYGILAQAALLHGDPDEAVRLVHLPAAEWHGQRPALRRIVADGVARSRPEEALQLYLEAAVDLVEQRGRANYAEAAGLLRAAREIYRRRGRADDWTLLLGEFRDGYKALRAFQDELRKAGL